MNTEQNNSTGFRTWWIPQIPGEPFLVKVADAAQGRWLENVLADYDLWGRSV
jgi:hypothetical protein